MNYKEFAEHWYEGSGEDADTERSLATTIDKHFVSRDAIRELEVRFARAINAISRCHNNASSMGIASDVKRLRGKVEGMELALSYLAELEATE